MVTKKISECQSIRLSFILEHPSIRRLLQQQFLNAWIDAFSPTHSTQFQARTIPIYRLKHHNKIVYRCSLALQLASQLQLPAIAIAQTLIAHLSANQSLEFTLELREKGVIDCVLCDRSLVVWLDQFPQIFLSFFNSLSTANFQENGINLFPLQYTHARCCALLRLGDIDGLIEFNTQHLNQPIGSWKAPNPIPWIFLDGIYEYRLIGQILNVVDDIEEVAPNHHVTLANQLCQALWELERCCRIWGEVKQKTPKLAQARLGLVALTQLVLRWLLQEKFKVTALIEL